MSKPKLTIGTIGHQGHGKSTLTAAMAEYANAKGLPVWGTVINDNLPAGPRYHNFPVTPDIGAFPIRQDITVLPADDPSKLRLGWKIYEEVGVVVINDYAITRLEVDPDTGTIVNKNWPTMGRRFVEPD